MKITIKKRTVYILVLLIFCAAIVSSAKPIPIIEKKTLDVGHELTKHSPKLWEIKTDKSTFTIESDVKIYELGDITKTREWEYKSNGAHYEILRSNEPLTIKGNHICTPNYVLNKHGETVFTECVYYPPQLVYEEGWDFYEDGTKFWNNLSFNTRNFTRIDDFTIRINFLNAYDPLLTNYSEGLVSWWSFDNDGTDFENNNDLTLENGASINSSEFIFNASLDLDGSNDHTFNKSSTDLQILGNVSFGCWARYHTLAGNNPLIMYADSGETEATNALYDVFFQTTSGNDIAYIHEYSGGQNELNTFDTNINLEEWYHIFITRDTTTNNVTLYLNGSFFDDFSYTNDPTGGTSADMYIGFNIGAGSDQYADGNIDECVVWNRHLNYSEVGEYYNKPYVDLINESGEAEPPSGENNNQTILFNLFLNDTQGNVTAADGESINVYYYTNVTGYGNLTRNGTEISNNSVQTLAVGVYNFTIRHDENTSAYGTNVSWWYIVTENATPADTTNPRINASINNTSPTINSVVNISANVSDEIALSFCQFISNATGSNTYLNFSLSGVTFCSQNHTITQAKNTVINFTVLVNDTSNNLNQSSFVVTVANSLPVVDAFQPTDTTPQFNYTLNVTFNITYSDADGDNNLLEWYVNGTFNVSQVNMSYFFNTIGTFNITANISNGTDRIQQEWLVSVINDTTDVEEDTGGGGGGGIGVFTEEILEKIDDLSSAQKIGAFSTLGAILMTLVVLIIIFILKRRK